MSTTEKSSEGKPPAPPVETDEEMALRHAKLRDDDWIRLKGCCGVPKAFAEATLGQYEKEQKNLWKGALRAGKWIFTFGPVGTGKTHLLSALVRSRYIWAWTCKFIYVPDFLSRIKRSFGSGDDEAADILYYAKASEFLAIDDLGTENLTPWSAEVLTSILNDRYAEKKATAISSNFDVDGLAERYERIADRIRERAIQVPLLDKRPERT